MERFAEVFSGLQGLLFEQLLQPVMFAAGLGQLLSDGFDATGWLLVGLLQLLLMVSVIGPLQRWRPVELVTDRIARVTPDGIVTVDGATRGVDVIVHATGFRPFDQSAEIAVRGRDGRLLSDEWRDGPQAFRGVAVTGFPNYFLIMGPNSGLGHNSILFMIESQVRYIRQCLSWLDSGRTDAVEVRPDVQDDFNHSLEVAQRRTVWKDDSQAGGCSSWYRHSSGRNTAIWPGFTSSYWLSTLRASRRDFLPARPRETAVPFETPLRRAA